MPPLPPGTFPDPAAAFRAGVGRIGGQAATSRLLGKSQPTINRRLKANREIWAESVIPFEEATGISKYDLRPDLYLLDPSNLDPAARFEAAR